MLKRPYINHVRPRSAFQQALVNKSSHLLTIRADSGKGKSTYIVWAKKECEANNIPVALIDL